MKTFTSTLILAMRAILFGPSDSTYMSPRVFALSARALGVAVKE